MASAGIGASVRSRSLPVPGARLRAEQLDTLQSIVTRHLQDPALMEIASTADFALTTDERGISHWEHGHLVAALDTLNTYQRNRRAKSKIHLGGHRCGMRSTYKHDPRTRFVELLKRWLRNNAASPNITEDEVRRMTSLCREIMNHPTLFPARNERSFMKTIAEVYQHLDVQLREVLERDRTCAELAQRVLSLSRNLVCDAIGYLLVGPTDLKRTDELPSVAVVSLWASLPSESHPLPDRIDLNTQRAMKDVWGTHCGKLLAGLLRTHWCVSLFEGAGAQEEAAAATPRNASTFDMSSLIEEIKAEFNGTSLKTSGLSGSFRKPELRGARMDYLAAVGVLVDLTYLIGEALVQFHRISDGLGDYGMIRVATWLHPFLEALTEKVHLLKRHLDGVNKAVDQHLVVASAQGYTVEKPRPTQRMGERASVAIYRAVNQPEGSHVTMLLKAMEDLRQRSSPDRLPKVVASIGDACMQLDAVLSSPEFRACVGDSFPSLPRIVDVAPMGQPQNQIKFDVHSPLQIEDVTEPVGSNAFGTTQCLRTAAMCDAPDAPSFLEPPTLLTMLASSSSQNKPPSRMDSSKICPDSVDGPPRVHQNPSSHVDTAISELHLQANVFRLTTSLCGPGLRRHDRRALRLTGGHLDVFEKSSHVKVKTSLNVKCDVEECCLLPGHKRLSLTMRRLAAGADITSGVWSTKNYFFEFCMADEAIAFHNEISRLMNL